jgi:hypothetical protein
VKRTQAATIATYFGVLCATLGTFFVFFFWNEMASAGNGRGIGPIKGRPPEALVWLNPYFAQADVMCGVEDGFGEWCGRVAFVTERPIFGGIRPSLPVEPGTDLRGGGVVNDVQPFGVVRDSFWPKSAVAWLAMSVVLIAASVQLVTPTRRWRIRLPGIRRSAGRAAS